MTELIVKRSGKTLYLVPTAIYIDGEKKCAVGSNNPTSIVTIPGNHKIELKCTWYPFFHSEHEIKLYEGKNICLFKEKSDTLKCVCIAFIFIMIISLAFHFLNATIAGIGIWGSIIAMLLFEIFTANKYFKINLIHEKL